MSRKSKIQALQRLKDAREAGYFVAVPVVVLASPHAAGLSPHACKLLLDLMSQYRPGRNGALCPAWAAMKKRGWRSKATLAKALKELRGTFLVMTKQGSFHHHVSLYAFSWIAIDPPPPGIEYNPGMTSTTRAEGTWRDGPTLEMRDTSRAARVPRKLSLAVLLRQAQRLGTGGVPLRAG